MLYHVLDYEIGHDEPPLVQEAFALFVSAFFNDNIGYLFNDFHYPVVGLYHVLEYCIGHNEPTIVKDSFPPLVTDFAHVPEHYEFPEKHVVLWGLFQIFACKEVGSCKRPDSIVEDYLSYFFLYYFSNMSCLLLFISFIRTYGTRGLSASSHSFILRKKYIYVIYFVHVLTS